jgi:hypothetical protein
VENICIEINLKLIPLGLINAGDTFQRAMDITFRGLINHNVVVYLNYVTIYSNMKSEHLYHLNQIFETCKKYGILLNPDFNNYLFLCTFTSDHFLAIVHT